MTAYDPSICDLCGSRASEPIVDWRRRRSLRSDCEIVDVLLRKLECSRCGLVRSGTPFTESELGALYGGSYRLGMQPEHLFYTTNGPVPRSRLICEWMVEHVGEPRLESARRCLEVGCGSGRLLAELAARFPHLELDGVEPGGGRVPEAAAAFRVHRGDVAQAPPGPYDGVYSVAVLEHVASPTEFLEEIRSRLADGGWFCLIQPTAEVPSYEVLFVDHLTHFGARHLRAYARKTGFREVAAVVGHPWMPNFSLHVWKADVDRANFTWEIPPARTRCRRAAEQVAADIAELDRLLAELHASGRRVALFGTNEVYWLARAYSSLEDWPVAYALNDAPEHQDPARIGLEVIKPEEAVAAGIDDVVLMMNTVYYAQTRDRLARLGLVAHPFLTG